MTLESDSPSSADEAKDLKIVSEWKRDLPAEQTPDICPAREDPAEQEPVLAAPY